MNGQEIRERVDENNRIISGANKATFILNKEVERALQENSELKATCIHSYVDGVCKWCDREEDK